MDNLPLVLEELIYKKRYQLHFQDCLDEIKKISYKIIIHDVICYEGSERIINNEIVKYYVQDDNVGHRIAISKNDEFIGDFMIEGEDVFNFSILIQKVRLKILRNSEKN